MNLAANLFPALLFFILPVMIGRPLVGFVYKRRLPYSFVSYFVCGALFFYSTFLILNGLLPTPISIRFITILFIISAVLANFFVPVSRERVGRTFPLMVIFIALSILGYAIWQIKSPYPLNWDIYEHQTLANLILNGKFSFFTSRISDTFGFDGYSTLFHTVIAASQSLVSIQVFEYWTMASIIHLILVVGASFLLTYEITENFWTSFVSACLGALIFDSTISFSNFFLIPQTLSSIVFSYLFIQLISDAKKNRLPPLLLILAGSLFLFLMHYIIGSIAVLFYVGSYGYLRFQKTLSKNLDLGRVSQIILFFLFLLILFSPTFPLGFLNRGEAAAFTTTFLEKFTIMKQSYGFLLLIFFPVGISAVIAEKNRREIVVLFITLILMGLVLLQIPYSLKFYVLARPFVHVILALGIYKILKNLSNIPLFYGSILIFGLILVFLLALNSSIWKEGLYYNSIFTQVSPYELDVAKFLKKEYENTNALLISDPATQHILEPLSGVNTQGGAYMNTNTRLILNSLSNESDPSIVATELFKVEDGITQTLGKRLFVAGGRYFLWQRSSKENKMSLSHNIWHPENLTLENYETLAPLLRDTRHFRIVYENPAFIIFEVQSEK